MPRHLTSVTSSASSHLIGSLHKPISRAEAAISDSSPAKICLMQNKKLETTVLIIKYMDLFCKQTPVRLNSSEFSVFIPQKEDEIFCTRSQRCDLSVGLSVGPSSAAV